MSTALEDDFVEELKSVPVGERLRRIRVRRDYETQDQLRVDLNNWLADRGHKGLSQGWLSGVESGQLQLTPKRRDQLAEVLNLTPEDAQLLDPEAVGVAVPYAIQRYAAWQGLRLKLAEEKTRMVRDQDVKLRCKSARNRIQDTLNDDDDLRDATDGHVERLHRIDALPLSTRWMLLIEAAYMEPFAPFVPVEPDFRSSRLSILETLVEELGIAIPGDPAPATHDPTARSGAIGGPGDNRGHRMPFDDARLLLKTIETNRRHYPDSGVVDRDPAGISRAFAAFVDSDEKLATLRGGGLVGALGWDAACGLFLTRIEVAISGRSADGDPRREVNLKWPTYAASAVPAGLLVGALTGMPTLGALVSGAAAAAVVKARNKAAHGIERSEADAAAIDAAVLLTAVGPAILNLELGKLVTLCAIRDQIGESAGWGSDEDLPSTLSVIAGLDAIRDALGDARKEREKYERSSAPTMVALKEMIAALTKQSAALRTLVKA